MKQSKLSLCAIILSIYASQVYAQEATSQKNDDDAELRLALAQIELYSETDDMDKAFSLIDKLKTEHPDDTQILLAEADLNMRIENRGSAFAAINKAQQLKPDDEEIIARRRGMFQDVMPFVSAGASAKNTNQAKERFITAGGQVYFDPTLSLGVLAENDHLKSKVSVVRADGTSEYFDSDRQRGTLSLGKIFNGGHEADAFAYIGNDTGGGGLQFSLWDRYGTTSLKGDISQPDWTFIETVVGKGTKDDISLTRKQHFKNKNIELSLGGALNRYNLEHDSDVARSESLDIAIGYTYPISMSNSVGDDLNLGLNYGLGAEYFNNRKTKVNAAGEVFMPLPAETYEVHSFTASLSRNFTNYLSADAFAGYAIDRFGSDGPLFGGGITITPITNLSLELLGSRGIMGESRIGTVDQFSANLKWKW
jgi:hypothetical protein